MKRIRSFILLAGLAVLASLTVQAQTVPADSILVADLVYDAPSATTDAPTIVADLAVKYPILTTALMILGLLRLIIKPVMAAVTAHVQSTPDTTDDERLARTERSWWFRSLLFILDWGASIKPVK